MKYFSILSSIILALSFTAVDAANLCTPVIIVCYGGWGNHAMKYNISINQGSFKLMKTNRSANGVVSVDQCNEYPFF